MISKSFHLWLLMVNTVTEGCRIQTVGPLEAKMQKTIAVCNESVQIHLIIYLLDLVKRGKTDWPFFTGDIQTFEVT